MKGVILIILLIVGFAVLLAFGNRELEKACEARGGWFTMIGGYPSCLPPGGRP